MLTTVAPSPPRPSFPLLDSGAEEPASPTTTAETDHIPTDLDALFGDIPDSPPEEE